MAPATSMVCANVMIIMTSSADTSTSYLACNTSVVTSFGVANIIKGSFVNVLFSTEEFVKFSKDPNQTTLLPIHHTQIFWCRISLKNEIFETMQEKKTFLCHCHLIKRPCNPQQTKSLHSVPCETIVFCHIYGRCRENRSIS